MVGLRYYELKHIAIKLEICIIRWELIIIIIIFSNTIIIVNNNFICNFNHKGFISFDNNFNIRVLNLNATVSSSFQRKFMSPLDNNKIK